jgi:hypothetical protein
MENKVFQVRRKLDKLEGFLPSSRRCIVSSSNLLHQRKNITTKTAPKAFEDAS